MKKLFLLLIIALTTFSSYSQPESQWKFGLHATPSVKWLTSTTDGVKSGGAKVGFSYGLVAEYFFGSRYSFCSGIDFSYRGGNLKYADTKYNYNLQYLEVPITIKMHTKEMDKKLFYAKFGLSPGWSLGTKGDEVPGGVNDFYLALKIGGGAEYEISDQTMIFAGLVWNNGFIDAFKSSDISVKNNSVELEIGILF
ncbi:MAG: outer membrane beta-barrel protein [Bacteroidia bacterium]